MATKNFVPINDGEGGIGTAQKNWLTGFFKNLSVGGKDVNSTLAAALAAASGPVSLDRLPTTVLRNYAIEAATGVTQRIANKLPSIGTLALYSVKNDASHTYAYNSSLWCADLDWTCISSSTSVGWRITMITPKHGVTATHIGMPVNTTGYWTDNNGISYSRIVTAVNNLGSDLTLVTLNADLPSAITPATVFPNSFPPEFLSGNGSLIGCPVITHDQNFNMCLATLLSLDTPNYLTDTIGLPTTGIYAPWNRAASTAGVTTPAIPGDSSSPYFIIIGNKPVLLGCFYSVSGLGVDIGFDATVIQPCLGTGYGLTVSVMPNYPYPIGVTSATASIITLPTGSSPTFAATIVGSVLNLQIGVPLSTIISGASPSNSGNFDLSSAFIRVPNTVARLALTNIAKGTRVEETDRMIRWELLGNFPSDVGNWICLDAAALLADAIRYEDGSPVYNEYLQIVTDPYAAGVLNTIVDENFNPVLNPSDNITPLISTSLV